MITYSIGLKNKFRGITVREGMLFEGPAGWAEWSPFLDYDDATCVSWLRAAREAAEVGWPAPVRDVVPVNCTVPADRSREGSETRQSVRVRYGEGEGGRARPDAGGGRRAGGGGPGLRSVLVGCASTPMVRGQSIRL